MGFLVAESAFSMKLDNAVVDAETLSFCYVFEQGDQLGFHEFQRCAASAAHREDGMLFVVAVMFVTGDERLDAFQAMRQPAFEQSVQGAIDRQWCPETVVV